MAKKTDARVIIHLGCTECKERNYTTVKNKKTDSQRLELNKYCPRCHTHHTHREVK